MAPLAPVELIERRRRGEAIDHESVTAFVQGWLDGAISDAQFAAWCMAAALGAPRLEETDALTRVLISSGKRLDLASIGASVDCQSSGAIGDVAPLLALPLAAALGVPVAHIAGHGVGCIAGALDVLAAIPGLRTDLSLGEFVACLRATGCVVVAPGADRVPALPRLDALRDATGTGGGVAPTLAVLLARSLAAGGGVPVLAVPVGRGAAVADRSAAVALVDTARLIAAPWGREVHAVVDDIDASCGSFLGGAPMLGAMAALLTGGGDPRVAERAVALAGAGAEASGACPAGEGLSRARAALAGGPALGAAGRWGEGPGGDPAVWGEPQRLLRARVHHTVCAPRAGVVADIDPWALGEAARWAGAGRLHPVQLVDPGAGLELLVHPGQSVDVGEPVMVVHASDSWVAERAEQLALAGVRFAQDRDVDA